MLECCLTKRFVLIIRVYAVLTTSNEIVLFHRHKISIFFLFFLSVLFLQIYFVPHRVDFPPINSNYFPSIAVPCLGRGLGHSERAEGGFRLRKGEARPHSCERPRRIEPRLNKPNSTFSEHDVSASQRNSSGNGSNGISTGAV